eukprot:9906210-Lingulodinium_polyedra.AAC.1
MPDWSSQVHRARDIFEGTILVVDWGRGQKSYYRFLYAVINPGYLALSPCTYIEQTREGLSVG